MITYFSHSCFSLPYKNPRMKLRTGTIELALTVFDQSQEELEVAFLVTIVMLAF